MEERLKANRTNFHSHCSFCDGKAPMEEFVKAAVAAGFTAYGVSSHAPLPFETPWTLGQDRVAAYLGELKRLREKYKDSLELYAGMEIDYLHETQHPSIPYFQEMPLDYRIGSVHLVYTPDRKIVDTDTNPENFRKILITDFHGDLRHMVSTYYEACMHLVEKGGFDFIGHSDKIAYNVSQCDISLIESEWYKKKRMAYWEAVAAKGLMVEINTKAYLGKGWFFPHVKNWKILKELRIPVMVNSDAHRPELIDAGRKEALALLKENGFKTVREMHEGKWLEVPIA